MSDSTAERTSVFNTQDPQSTLLSVNMSSVTKLTPLNYLMWSRQVRALLEGHELQHFIDDTNSAPSQTVLVDAVSSPNPAYAPWRRQDRLLYSSMIGAISLPVQPVVSSATTTKEVWSLLATTFGNPSRGHIRQLKHQIKQCSKGTQTISEYLRSIKSKADDLALLGKPMDAEDLTEQILAGLGDEYKPEIDAINGRDLPISYSELHERLLNREAMIMCTEGPSVGPIVAHAADAHPRQQWRNNHNRPTNNHNNSNRANQNNNPRFFKPYLGRCQACGVTGHSVKYCPEYRIVKGVGPSSPMVPHMRPNTAWNASPQFQSWQPTANPALMSDSSTWLVDSGASHHMTSDLNNLAFHHPYPGGDGVLLGDGSGLQISHSGERLTNGNSTSRRET
uniref:CCHC-type domain-containing protein n=1 Tax=Noccaea caerulescens TaxID=107243 RepID=A0A1J3I1T7_NOCCA